MPPDDDLFSGEGEPVSSDTTPQGTSTDTVNAPAPPPGVTQEELAGLIQQFVEPNTQQMASITQTQSDLTAAVQAIAERVGLGATPQTGGGEVDVSDFLSDPQTHIANISKESASEAVREQVAPLLAQLVQQTYNTTLSTQEAAVNSEFGPDAWKDHFWPELKPIFDRTQKEAPSQLGNTEAIQRAIDTVKGAKFETLADARVKALQSRNDQTEADKESMLELVKSNLTGGISRGSSKAVLSEGMKDYIEREFRATGEKPDEKSFQASLNSGTTLEDWQAAQAAAKKG
jgi:hypothetical protein